MTGLQNCSPHVYYSVKELLDIEDVGLMKNRKIKAIGYIGKTRGGSTLKETVDSEDGVLLDLNCIEKDSIDIRPYIVFGLLYTINNIPVITAKSIRRLDCNSEFLEAYKKQCLTLRDRYKESEVFLNDL